MNERKVFDAVRAKLKTAVAELPDLIGNEAVNFSLDAFQLQGWTDTSFTPWKPRAANTKKNTGRSLLVQRGRLRASIRVIRVGTNTVVIGSTGVPYARIHNYGGTIQRHPRSETFLRNRLTRGINKGRFKKGTSAGRGFTFKDYTIDMPQRRFLGRSQALTLRLMRVAKTHLEKQLNTI